MDYSTRAAIESLRARATAMKQAAREKAAQPTEPTRAAQRAKPSNNEAPRRAQRRQKPFNPRDPAQNPPWLYTLEEGEEFDPRNPLHNPPDLSGILLPRTEPAPQVMKLVVKTAASSRPIRKAAAKAAGAPLPVPEIIVTAPPAEETTVAAPPVPKKKMLPRSIPKPTMAPPPVRRAAAAAQPVSSNTAKAHPVAILDATLLSVPVNNRGKRGGARPGAGRKPKNPASRTASPNGSPAPEAVTTSVTAGQTVVPTTAAPIAGSAKRPLPRIVIKNAPGAVPRQPVSNAGPSTNIQPQQPPSLATPGYAPASPNPLAPPAIPTAKGNPNTHRYPGKFLTKILYVKGDAKLMSGKPWTEEEDLLFWYLKDKGMTYSQITPYLHPHPAGGCQSRWGSCKNMISTMNEQEKEVAEREKARVGQLFESGAFEYRVALAAEAERLNPKVKSEGSGKGKGKRKAAEMSEGDEVAEENGDELEREAKVAKKE